MVKSVKILCQICGKAIEGRKLDEHNLKVHGINPISITENASEAKPKRKKKSFMKMCGPGNSSKSSTWKKVK
ncbi:hypothetical protein [Alishewanella sp. HL-SH06]|uniref:hypothetical protein n=1 Tax=Alishewanella sp. HL-SH06 TaxID=3461144 RepID=UPI004042AEAA